MSDATYLIKDKPRPCSNCDTDDTPIALGNGRSRCLGCGLMTATPHEVKHWNNPRYAEADQ